MQMLKGKHELAEGQGSALKLHRKGYLDAKQTGKT